MTEMWWIDAFTSRPFAGNPAAVAFLDRWPSDAWLAAVAREMNLSETAFLVPAPGAGRWQLRWFTPATEVELCGHATLASARALVESKRVRAGDRVSFATAGGDLLAEVTEEGVELDFPATPPEEEPPPAGLLPALGLARSRVEWIGRSRFDWFVVVREASDVVGLAVDFRALIEVDTRGVVVTARTAEGADFVSRFFAPAAGVDEDPVTGSAHCSLAPYWSAKTGRDELRGRQLSSRGGTVRTRLVGDRVRLGGSTVVIARGSLLVAPG
jgi:PhzF family phenazine biosynthesis protein